MGVVGDHYSLVLRGHSSGSGVAIQNQFIYELTDGTGTAMAFGDYWEANVLPSILGILSSATVVDDLYVVNLDDPSDFHVTVSGATGVVGDEAMPPFVAFEFEYVRTTRAINNGRKSFGLVAEGSVTGGVISGATATAAAALADLLGSNLTDVVGPKTWAPRLWRRPGTYASGVVSAPGLFYPVQEVNYRRVSTQNTRKIGRGA